MRTPVLLAVVLLAGFGTAAQAGPIAYSLQGTVGRSNVAGIAIGTGFTGTFLYDPDATLVGSAGNTSNFASASSGVTMLIEGTTFQTVSPVTYLTEHDVNFGGFLFPNADYDALSSWSSFTPIGALGYDQGMLLIFVDADTSAFTATTAVLPASIAGFEYIQFTILGYPDPEHHGTTNYVEGLVTSFEPVESVPDPGSSLLLLGIGLAGLRATRKRWQ